MELFWGEVHCVCSRRPSLFPEVGLFSVGHFGGHHSPAFPHPSDWVWGEKGGSSAPPPLSQSDEYSLHPGLEGCGCEEKEWQPIGPPCIHLPQRVQLGPPLSCGATCTPPLWSVPWFRGSPFCSRFGNAPVSLKSFPLFVLRFLPQSQMGGWDPGLVLSLCYNH